MENDPKAVLVDQEPELNDYEVGDVIVVLPANQLGDVRTFTVVMENGNKTFTIY